jgi:hypothetical protein
MNGIRDLKDTVRASIEMLEGFNPSVDRDVLISTGKALLAEEPLDVIAVMDWLESLQAVVKDIREELVS